MAPKTLPEASPPAIDPTKNVIALVESNARSEAALRRADIKFNDAQGRHIKEIGQLRARHAETLRVSDLARLAKTREVDVKTAEAQAAAIATAVQTLAVASDKNAEAIRSQLNADRAALAKQVTDTAATLSANNDSAMKDVNNRIAELQKSSYQGVGKSSVADPMMADFVVEMKKMASGVFERAGRESVTDPAVAAALVDIKTLLAAQATGVGKSAGLSQGWAILTGAILLALAIYGGVFKSTAPAAAVAPQVIYVPAPAAGTGAPLPGTAP